MTDCIIWQGYIDPNSGYGRTRNAYAHRLAYIQVHGSIPEGLQIDHLCRNRSCVNVEHLEAVTQAENIRRALPFRTPVTACKRGHEYTPENTFVNVNGGRECRQCLRARRAAKRTGRELITNCHAGHSMDDAYILPNGYRACRECRRAAVRRYRAKRGTAA